MSALSKLTCTACNKSATLLTAQEIDTLLAQVSGWKVIDDGDIQKLTRQFETKNYQQSLSFTNAVAEMADSINHHPQIVIEYSSVTVVWWSHIIKGLHKNDFIMAAKTSDLF